MSPCTCYKNLNNLLVQTKQDEADMRYMIVADLIKLITTY